MSAIIGTIGTPDDNVTVSVGDGGTVYIGDSARGEWFFGAPDALKLADLLERAAVHREADPRTRLEQAQDQIQRLEIELARMAARTVRDDDPGYD
jgi:hypothetical protein